ncbi:MAG: hypothetical protein M1140_17880 [Chloroflexi bacterium]|nr:hypothetical protein [Chloroflexota bacterium]
MFRQKASLISVLISGMLLVAGCNTPTQTAAPTTVDTPQPSTTAPAATPTEPATSAVIATVPATTLPEATVTLSSNPTSAPAKPTPTATGVATYKSTALGISFRYLTSDNKQKFAVKETGDRIYVYMANAAPDSGQWVKVYGKPIKTSLVDAIKSQILNGYSTSDCIVKQVPDPNAGNGSKPAPGWSFAAIDVPRSADDDMGTLLAKVKKCPQTYLNVNGLAYFVTDANYPNRFLFFSIGQYSIPAEQNHPWQTTVQFTAPSSSTGNPVTLPANQYLSCLTTSCPIFRQC